MIFILLTAMGMAYGYEYSIKEEMLPRDTFIKLNPSDPSYVHSVVFSLEQNSIDLLADLLMDMATPGTEMYQQWLNGEDLMSAIDNTDGLNLLTDWLNDYNITKLSLSLKQEYLTVTAPISILEEMLNTDFYYWEDRGISDQPNYYHRCESYSLPTYLLDYISAVFNTCQTPPVLNRNFQLHKMDEFASSRNGHFRQMAGQRMTPSFLNNLYGISTNQGSTTLGQAVFQTNHEGFLQSDLTLYQQTYNIPLQPALVEGNGPVKTTCDSATCGEGSLDIQTMMGLARGSDSYFWFSAGTITGDPYLDFINAVANYDGPPTVLSISWGTLESQMPGSLMRQFNIEALKLSTMGITIVVSTGDDGAIGYQCGCTSDSSSFTTYWSGENSWSGKGYFPQYPASCPYVLAVGATQGPESGGPEIAAQSDLGMKITTGGGFSTYYPQPDYQKAAVQAYLNSAAGRSNIAGFNPMGRAYPDISFIGVNYPVIISGQTYLFYGTSASTPVAAALLTLVNTKRQALGMPTLGFVNPTLYNNANAFNDIVSGFNNCCAGSTNPTCCDSGFHAGPGWDPLTGLGSIQFDKLVQILTRTPTDVPTMEPTDSPTYKPTNGPPSAVNTPVTFPSTNSGNNGGGSGNTPTLSPTTTIQANANNNNASKQTEVNMIGIVIGVVAGSILFVIVWCTCCKFMGTGDDDEDDKVAVGAEGSPSKEMPSKVHVYQATI